MPFLILDSEEGGMYETYIVGSNAFIESVKKHRYCAPEDIEIATNFANEAKIGDFVNYSKGSL